MLSSLQSVRGKGLLVFLGTSAALLLSVVASSTKGMPACLFNAITGIPCASCGMTRAFLDLGHGRFTEALRHNLASPLVFIATWALLVAALLQAVQGQERITTLWHRVKIVFLPAVLSLLLVGWIYRLWHTFKP